MNVLQNTARNVAGWIGRDSWLVQQMRPTYESLLDYVAGRNGIPWEINGVTYRVSPYHRHRLGQNYDAPVAAFLRERVQPGAVCFDVGANVGVYVLQFAHWSRPNGRVVAFEPNPTARAVLEQHVRFNNLTNRVRVVPAAVSNENGEAILYAASADGMSRLGEANQLIAEKTIPVNVSVVTLDAFCEAEQLFPDWLFIDIEGFEINALAGARNLIATRGEKLGVIVEMHPNVWSSANTTREKAEALLSSMGRNVIPLTGQTDPLSEYGLVYLSCE